jgi:hypothetical protein
MSDAASQLARDNENYHRQHDEEIARKAQRLKSQLNEVLGVLEARGYRIEITRDKLKAYKDLI